VAIFLVGCGGSSEWPRMDLPDEGGWSVSIPGSDGAQVGAVEVAGSSLTSHAIMFNDSGITYVAAWYDLSPSIMALGEPLATDTVWNTTISRLGQCRESLTGVEATVPFKETWCSNGEGVRSGIRQYSAGQRKIVLIASGPEEFFDPGIERNMRKFLGSLRPSKG